jgi:hypothetical protein
MVDTDYSLLREGVQHINARFNMEYDADWLIELISDGVLFYLQHPSHPAFMLFSISTPLSGGRYLFVHMDYADVPNKNAQRWLLQVLREFAKECGAQGIQFNSTRKGWAKVFKGAEIGRTYQIGV